MDTKFFLGIGLAIVLVFCGAAVYTSFTKLPATSAVPEDRETLYQVSTIDALMQGVFDGVQPVAEIKKHGDFGIGTFDALDGEMIILDNKCYQARADGLVYPAPDTTTSPLAMVTYFNPDLSAVIDQPMNYSEFSSTMSARLPTQNMIYAVRIHGTFPAMKIRAIPRQHKPYPTLTDAARNQSVYTFSNSTGTIVGLYMPEFMKGLNVAGYHLHYISDDHLTGGHVLDFAVLQNTIVEYDITPGFMMSLPTGGEFAGVNLSKNLTGEIANVER
jgi:acetolactate decarboxylase